MSRLQLERTRRPSLGLIVVAVVLIALVVVVANLCSTAASINVSVNGTTYSLRGAKTMQVALKECGLPINPGDYISLQGNILQRSAGHPFCAIVNGEETADPDYQLHDGDQITLTDGKDIVEDYDATQQSVPFEASIVGSGPIHTFRDGAEGVLEIRTGRVSGEVAEKQTVDPQDLIEARATPDVGTDKVIALTFDNGPSTAYTENILNILVENDAKATFFCLGSAIDNGGADLVRKAREQGCQICTHGYDNEASIGGDLSRLTPDELASQIDRGVQSITNVIGEDGVTRKVRLGSDEIPLGVILNLAPHIEAEIGWTLDTGDWVYTPEEDIYDVLISAKPGDVVRMHDGGDHQDITAQALKRALPKLKAQGYSFVTVDELMAYQMY